MAWNEPGGGNNKPKDPWGGGDQGPPDLDEALKKLQEKLGGLFGGRGGKSGGGGGGRGRGVSAGLLGVIALIAVVVWGLMGLYQVDEQERAVVLRFGKYQETVRPGLQWNPPLIDEVIRVNTTKVRAVTFREIMLTQDENIVEVHMSVQYVIVDPTSFVLKVRDPEDSLQHAAQSALRHVVGDSRMDSVLTEGRAQIGTDVQVRLQRYTDMYETGIRVVKVNIDESKPPGQVQAAFDDVIKAREDEERLKNEAQAYANGIVPEARGRAQRVLEEAGAYREQVVANAEGEAERFNALLAEYSKAPEVTRERLYLEAVQEVFSNTNKVMVDVEGGNNVMYLPLDKMTSSSGAAVPRSGRIDANTVRELTDAVTEQLRQDAAAANNRRGGR
ncbi:MAG TPA: FtsH protease activity modulator HflK [Haliea salexigens]|uniref:Protein HflK n=1 Tax=Haliea salexigens TaxID=287487 RepID=A0A3C1KRM3_9GAMM|nr:FtsH protease activity modulator HflK [Haliea salexigens]HAN29231.1 FtsH protease activity modulator HflK [Haliea salexigens]|tara:strand:+ start:3548 stop:4711 length:1164 start_codon:yes stop_codon:yes gene_type:complete